MSSAIPAVSLQQTATDIRPRERLVGGLVLIQVLLLYAPTFLWLWDRWTLSVWHNAHGLFIPPVVAYLFQRAAAAPPRPGEAKRLGVRARRSGSRTAGPRCGHAYAASVGGDVRAPGPRRLAPGPGNGKDAQDPVPPRVSPFALPIPLAFTEPIHWQLRQMVTHVTAAVLPWLGIPVFREGTTLTLPNGVIQIADACSGFSTLYATLAVACLTAYSTPTMGRRLCCCHSRHRLPL